MFAYRGEIVKSNAKALQKPPCRALRHGRLDLADCDHLAVAAWTRPAVCAVALALLAGCGGDSDFEDTAPAGSEAPDAAPREVPGDADPEAVGVIGAWADTLREGDVEGAADYFAIPSTAENGPFLIRIRSSEDAVEFNESLPCGAELVRAEGAGEFVTATFRLTERPGPGTCGAGAGELAKTAFVIRDGEIVEWRRVGTGAPESPGQAV
jgi:hypothetical protein